MAIATLAAGGCGTGGSSSGSGGDLWTQTSPSDVDPVASQSGGGLVTDAYDWPVPVDNWAMVSGRLVTRAQVDVYNLGPARAGERLQVDVAGSGSLNAAVAVLDASDAVLVTNDDRSYYGGLIDPLAYAYVLHDTSNLYVAVSSSPREPGSGAYTLEVERTADAPYDGPFPQNVYLNFDGADDVRIGTRDPVDVPPFDAGVIAARYAQHSEEIISLLVQKMADDYVGLNVYFYSSREGPPPAEAHTTIHFGTYDPDLLGVAENVDEFNLDGEQQAIIFVDTFAAFANLNPSVEEVSQALANVASHECGHLLGLYHCRDPQAIMDVTATLRQMLADQVFTRAPIHEEYFSIGYQDAVQVLFENVGGDPVLARQAAASIGALRSSWYDADDGPPARESLIFGTCPHCSAAKAHRHTHLQEVGSTD